MKVETFIDRIDRQTILHQDLVRGYAEMNKKHPYSYDQIQVHQDMYKIFDRRIAENMELAWVLTKAEKEGVTI